MPTPAPAISPAEAARRVRALCEAEGFGLVGITDARPTEHAEELERWIAEGQHGEMHYLADRLRERLDPTLLVEGARSIVAVADFYESVPPADADAAAQPRGRIARYAWGDDYHRVTKKRLHRVADALRAEFPGHRTRATVDTAPLLEREVAMRAGLGWQGKNTMLIHPRLGSFFLLGAIITTLELETSQEAGWPGATVAPADHCGTCTRCIDACPTSCITSDPAPGSPGGRRIDATRCISYLTLEHRSPIAPELQAPMGQWIAGCDVCQEVCPFNRVENRGASVEGSGVASDNLATLHARCSTIPIHPRLRARADIAAGLPLLDVLGWTDADRQQAFIASALKRVKLDMLKRNALIALSNALVEAPNPQAMDRIAQIDADESESELVRVTARQVLARLTSSSPPEAPPA